MEEVVPELELKKVPCKYCGQNVSKTNLKRHEDSCKKNLRATIQNFKCDFCNKSFNRRDNLKTHLNKCTHSQKHAPKTSPLPCSYAECSYQCHSLTILVNHLKNVHDAPVSSKQTLNFENENSFINWKEEEQSRSYSYFSKKSGDYNTDTGLTKYFYCQQHGSEKPHRKSEESSRKTDRRVARGRVKVGQICISSMKATYLKDGSVTVIYQPTHSHPVNPSSLQFHPLSKESYKFIDKQLAAGASPSVIKRELKNRATEKATFLHHENTDNYKDCDVSLKLIRERARRQRNSSKYHEDDAKSVMLLTQHLMKSDPDLVLVYKPLGMSCYIGPKEIDNLPDSENIFMYGLQTKDQRELMFKGCKVILAVDETDCTNRYGFTLLTMLVVDENGHGWPVGHFIYSKGDEQCLQFLFSALRSKCPDLEINCVITDDDPKLINAMELGFGQDLRHILCMWHLSENFQKQLREKAPKYMIDDMFADLKLIVDAKNYSEFKFFEKDFITKYKEIALDFVLYLEQYYLTAQRVPKWAKCFRNFPHGHVDTTGYIKSFHKRLKSTHMKRTPNRRLDILIQLLITNANNDNLTRKHTNLNGVQLASSSIDIRHKRAMELADESIQDVFEDMWEVSSATVSGRIYRVTGLEKKCSRDLCFCKCKECFGLCSHLYHCSCDDNEPLCKHIHKVHSFINRYVAIDHVEVVGIETQQPFFSEPLDLPATSADEMENVERGRHEEILKNRLLENLNKIRSLVQNTKLPEHILTKLDSDIDCNLKFVEAQLEDTNEVPKIAASVFYSSDEKFKIQVSQMLPFKRPEKRRKPFNAVSVAAKKKVVSADLIKIPNNSSAEDVLPSQQSS